MDPYRTPTLAAPPAPPADGEVPVDALLEILEGARLGVQYEPIVELRSGRTVAHEALARFHRADGGVIAPGPVFAWLRRAPSLLVETELALKRLELERSPGRALFVNLDPESWTHAPDGGGEFLSLLSGAPEVVVEVIEMMALSDAAGGHALVAGLRAAGLPYALDDVGAEDGLVSLDLLAWADYIKLDRSLARSAREPRRAAVVHALVELATRTGARVVLEGIETSGDLALARDLGVTLVQGWLFRDRFVEVVPGGGR